jgi:transposase
VPLSLWFHTILVFSNAKCGISARVIERDLEVTYKCAWRMLTLIRGALKQGEETLYDDIEVDTGYIGGRSRQSAWKRNKTTVFAAKARGGEMRAEATVDGSAKSHKHFIWKNVSTKNTRLLTDGAKHFVKVATLYHREAVNHSKGEYVRGDVHVSRITHFEGRVIALFHGLPAGISGAL